MEKSIESIWKKGFLKNNDLIAPKLNDLYNRKSEHLFDKYKRMFKNNMKWLTIGSIILLIVSYFVRMPILGIMMFFMLNTLVIVDRKLLQQLEKIDKNRTSYEYLKKLESWMQQKNQINIKMARILYPYVFLTMVISFWFLDLNGKTLGATLVSTLLESFPDMTLVFGVPLFLMIGILFVLGFLAYIGKRLYLWDLNMVYGNVLKKLKELIADMEELKN